MVKLILLALLTKGMAVFLLASNYSIYLLSL